MSAQASGHTVKRWTIAALRDYQHSSHFVFIFDAGIVRGIKSDQMARVGSADIQCPKAESPNDRRVDFTPAVLHPPSFSTITAQSFRQFVDACTLVHFQYCAAGYMKPCSHQMRVSITDLLPSSIAVVAVSSGRVRGTATVKLWSSAGIPAQGVYAEEVTRLVRTGRRLMETTKFACEKSEVTAPRGLAGMSAVATDILRALFATAVHCRVEDWLVVVNPRVHDLYVNHLGFELIAGERACPHVQRAPGILLRLPIDQLLKDKHAARPLAREIFFRGEDGAPKPDPVWRPSAQESLSLLLDAPELLSESSVREIRQLLKAFPLLARPLRMLSMKSFSSRRGPRSWSTVRALLGPARDPGREAQGSHYAPRPFALRRLVRELAMLSDVASGERGMLLRTIIDDQLPDYLYCDPDLLGSVFLQLSRLALTQQGTSAAFLRVSGARTEAREIEVTVTLHGVGCTLPTEVVDLARQLDARVVLASEADGSVSLSVTMYAAQVDTAVDAALTPDDSLAAQPLPLSTSIRVLVAEDNAVSRLLLERVMRRWGVSVTSARHGDEAVRLARAGNFDLILMDIQMPVLDGYQSARLIRDVERTERLRKTPLYALTAMVMPDDQRRAIAAGMDGHIPKPVRASVLRDLLTTIARRKTTQQARGPNHATTRAASA